MADAISQRSVFRDPLELWHITIQWQLKIRVACVPMTQMVFGCRQHPSPACGEMDDDVDIGRGIIIIKHPLLILILKYL